MLRVPPILRALVLLTGAGVLVLSALRFIFFLAFSSGLDPVPTGELLQAFYLGLKFDLRLVLIVLLPLALLGGLPWLDPMRRPAARWGWSIYLGVVVLGGALFYGLDFGHYAYLTARVDATVLRFLDNTDISLQMVQESYPVGGITVAIIAVSVLGGYAAYRLFARLARSNYSAPRRRARVGMGFAAAALILLGLYGKISWYPLRWSDAFFGPHAFTASLAANPVLYFIDTRGHEPISYRTDRVRETYPLVSDYLGVDAPDAQMLRFDRQILATTKHAQPLNIVLVQLESFASYKTSLSGNPLDPTPHMAALARDGAHFSNFFVPHTGTARAVFATLTGTPDVALAQTSSRNPTVVSQQTLIDQFEGYEKFYFLGGSASWGNIRGLLSHNIRDLHLYEEGSYQSPRTDVWGISDLALFDEANQVLRQQQRPFFAYIQTSGGHRPYTIPDDRRGFETHHPGEETVKKYGFISEPEYNSFRFLDHAVGQFMAAARQEPYFENTVFVFFGDHGLGGDTGEHSPQAEAQLELSHYRVPLVLYAPGLLQPQHLEKVASQVDVMPTVAALAGIRHQTRTFGRDLFNPDYDDRRYAFVMNHNRRQMGLIHGEHALFMPVDGGEATLHSLKSDDPRNNLAPQDPARAEAMAHLNRALYETAKYLLHHNTRPNHSATGSDQVNAAVAH